DLILLIPRHTVAIARIAFAFVVRHGSPPLSGLKGKTDEARMFLLSAFGAAQQHRQVLSMHRGVQSRRQAVAEVLFTTS
ncbi:hypothetical protein, partial [Mesorhizobium sp. M1A.F.Ca.IN.020.03.2.1]|uniref:hypothetical protein n=1 Tax=Mesorhizobium sp. M1A.F.Ca.IN.020.03.2.1 TaxID=2496769 RepID=UPI0019D48212